MGLARFSFPGNFGFVKRDLFEEIGGFDSRFIGYGGEDDFIAYLLFRNCPDGFKFLFDEISVAHINHPIANGKRAAELGQGYEMYMQLLKSQGVKSFNINILFGVPDYEGQQIVEKYEKT
jgi:predicted glycosyltransferase involved in capsule biosynthesis